MSKAALVVGRVQCPMVRDFEGVLVGLQRVGPGAEIELRIALADPDLVSTKDGRLSLALGCTGAEPGGGDGDDEHGPHFGPPDSMNSGRILAVDVVRGQYRHVSQFEIGWGTWARTTIIAVKVRCPTVRRSPNVMA